MIRHATAAILLYAVSTFVSPALADVARGVEYFERGEFRHAYDELLPDARGGDARAQYIVGVILLNDLIADAPADKGAAYWITLAAEQDYVQAQTELARMYKTGDHVAADPDKMLVWYERAADSGDVGAQLFVADAYAYGQGVKVDLVLAYMWYDIALEYWGSLAVRARDLAAEKMTAEQVAEAEKRAQDWRKAHSKDAGKKGE
ncbi:MAG TPA: tetratricopeptide repeat protein [Parvularculaceae bacterium]|nr:tetratricopeptide repeat protein [Parvularculaceae bacterium]